MRLERIVPGTRPPVALTGAVLTRDLSVAGARWAKGRRLSAADLEAVAGVPAGRPITVLVMDPDEVHEDDAGRRLALAVTAGDPTAACLVERGPSESRINLHATAAGVVEIRVTVVERLNRVDPLEVFTVFDGQVVAEGDLVGSVKVGPHVVAGLVVEAGERIAARAGGPVIRVRPFRPVRLAVLVKEHVTSTARERFEASVRAKAAGLGATLTGIDYVRDDPDAVVAALEAVTRGPGAAAIVLTAGGASTDPADAFYVAVDRLGGRIVRHGVPSHPGSMLWLGRIGRAAIIGLPSCGAFSKATAADLLLPRLVAGQPATAATVAKLGHGGILTRSQRFRFPAYARDLDAPDG
ncbi:MAG TPA: molybdopterin-binding protein [Candidatus Limnocylindrales bacterium]